MSMHDEYCIVPLCGAHKLLVTLMCTEIHYLSIAIHYSHINHYSVCRVALFGKAFSMITDIIIIIIANRSGDIVAAKLGSASL